MKLQFPKVGSWDIRNLAYWLMLKKTRLKAYYETIGFCESSKMMFFGHQYDIMVMWKKIKARLNYFWRYTNTYLLFVLTGFKNPVNRDRWLFGRKGSGMVIFAIVIAVLVPLIIWGFAEAITKINNLELHTLLLNNYDTATGHSNGWAILSQYADPGNLPAAQDNPTGYIIAIICAIAGVFCLSGLAVSSFINLINRMSERWKLGLLRYDIMFKDYVVIIGCNNQTANLVKLVATRKDVKHVLIMTSQNIEKMRMRLDLDLDKDEEDKVVFYYAERTSREDIEQLHVERAKDIFILGEGAYSDEETDHDIANISCLENISEYLKGLKDFHEKKRVHVNLEYQSTFTAFKYTHIYRSLDKNVEFIPYNIHEIWAKKILVDNFAVVPIGKKGEFKVQEYLPIDSLDGIKADDTKTVHFVIVGMNQMGTALGVQAALMCHFPNAHKDRNLRTTITFIDDQAVKEGEFLKGRFATMFDLCRHRTIVCDQDKASVEQTGGHKVCDFSTPWVDPMKNGRYSHLGENFMDIQWEFIQGNVASEDVRSYLESIATDPEKISTFAICFNHPQDAVAAALYLPEMVYRRALQILVYQQGSFDLATKIATGEKVWKRYEKLRPFGMIDGSYTESAFDNSAAKILFYLFANGHIRTYAKEGENCPYGCFKVPDLTSFVKLTPSLAKEIGELWNRQGIVDKLSNIDMVESIPMKLRSLGITMDNIEDFDNHTSVGKTMEYMAKAEHTRWVTERITMGYRPLDNVESEWGFFSNPDLSENARKKEKKYRKDKSRAHLDICSNTTLKVIDPNIHYNDIAVISYIPQMLRYKEWLNIMKLAFPVTRDSVMGKLMQDYVVTPEGAFAFKLIDNGADSFWIMDTTVSQRQWKAIMGINPTPAEFKSKDKPIVNVSKLEMDDYLKVLRKRTGLYFDLPTLFEWRTAATKAIGSSSFEDIVEHIRFTTGKDDKKGPVTVRSNPKQNRRGIKLFNILGNVWEWTKTEAEDAGCFYFCGGSWRFKDIQCNLSGNYWNSYWKPVLKANDMSLRLVWRFNIHSLETDKQREIEKSIETVVSRPIELKKYIDINTIDSLLPMVPIEAGYFVMGTENCETALSHPDFPKTWIDKDASIEETPHHFVRVKRFKISETPVTQALWNAVMGCDPKANPSVNQGDNYPQTDISWDLIKTGFLTKLNDLTGRSYRLPTEAEWEYVAKGGHDTDICRGLTEIFEDSSLTGDERRTKAYAFLAATPRYPLYGASDNGADLDLYIRATTSGVRDRDAILIGGRKVYDMNGNIWEWCEDFYQNDFYEKCITDSDYRYAEQGFVSNPVCEDKSYAAHSFRGGSWRFDAKNCRSTSVNYWISSDTDDDLGFRLVLDYED